MIKGRRRNPAFRGKMIGTPQGRPRRYSNIYSIFPPVRQRTYFNLFDNK